MFFLRLYFLCVALVATSTLGADPKIPSQTPEKSGRKAPTEQNITFNSVHTEGPHIAMTFDDGPSPTLTPKLLDLLAARHIKVTFFVIGENVAEHPEIVARAAREGHEIGNHSWSHPNFAKMSEERVRHTARSQHGRNVGSMVNWVMISFFGTSILMTGNVPAQPSFVAALSKRL